MPQLYQTEVATVADYQALREAQPDAIIPAVGEPWVADGHTGALMIYARDGEGRTGWYHQAGDVFIPD
jgi:hypothetical protein